MEEAMEGATATLHCELSKASPVEWRKGPEILRPGDRVSLRQDGVMCELEIRGLMVADAGEYSCVCGQERTSASLTVQGKDCVQPYRAEASCLRDCSCPLVFPFCVQFNLLLLCAFPAVLQHRSPSTCFCEVHLR